MLKIIYDFEGSTRSNPTKETKYYSEEYVLQPTINIATASKANTGALQMFFAVFQIGAAL